jgi:hypothetical protein
VRNNPLQFIDPTGGSCIKTDDGLWADDGDGKGCDRAGVAPGEDPKETIRPGQIIVTLTHEEKALLTLQRAGELASDLSVPREGLQLANPVVGAIVDCVEGDCGAAQALAFIPYGKFLKNVRIISSGRLRGFLRGVTELAGGEQAAKQIFQQLAGRLPKGEFDRVVKGTSEFAFRSASKSASGSPAVEIIDHSRRTLEVIHFQ